MWRSQSPSRSARRNRCMMITGVMKQSTHRRPVLETRTTSSSSWTSSTDVFTAMTTGWMIAVRTFFKPLIAFVHAFPFNIFPTPLKATLRISSKPLPFIRVQTQPTEDMRICIPPGRTMRCCHRLGSDHLISWMTFYSSISADKWTKGLVCRDSSKNLRVVRIVSSWDGGMLIKGPKTKWLAGP